MCAYDPMAVRSSALIAVTLAASACVPAPTTYLKPSAPGGEYTQSICGGVVGPYDRLVLAGPGGVMIGVESYSLEELSAVRAFRQPNTLASEEVGTGFSVIVHIPVGRTVRFASRSFFLTDQVTQAVHEYQGTSVLDFADARVLLDGLVAAMQSGDSPRTVRQVDLTTIFTGVPQSDWVITPRWFGRTLDHPYYVIVPFDGVTCVDCRLRLPPIAVDSTTYEFPEVSFKLVKEWLLWPLNC